ncbi:CD3324 family protein [Anaeromicrobium sediminis]|uniref:Mor transcription activator domain-containing protein n=1 Tax=Anaeromicrobium sediminis TaxID=1478221 RepID=A0A267MN60_9FIRM|nr:CD3324 family protein [Anaeromicrobium sediminis]PAB61041.1 hypothetical protein CCE28_01005 [Anaeromicrobium sediminis]
MSYKNGKDILPKSLLIEIQKYVEGELIYIPKNHGTRVPWGQVNGTREFMEKRNMDIYHKYKEGHSIDTIMEIYNLSESSIRKIILKSNKGMR